MDYEWAKPGVKCVCINAHCYYGSWYGVAPVEGGTYVFVAFGNPGSQPTGHFETVDGTPVHNGGCIWISRFRPLITKTQEQDVEMFLRLASPSPLERLDLLAERMNELAED